MEKKVQKNVPQAQCFVIMPISSQNGYEDDHFQLVYEDIIKPAITESGLTPLRADENKNTNLIHLDILRNVIESPIAICDMSSKNPNVFYELGMRQAFDLPTVLIRDETTEAPFDVNGLRYVTYKKEMKHRDVISAIKDLKDALIDTYKKRNDKSEINSLIRLMELANPAKIHQVDLTDEARFEKLNEFHLQEILANIKSLNVSQIRIMEELYKTRAITEKNTLYKPRVSSENSIYNDNWLTSEREREKVLCRQKLRDKSKNEVTYDFK